MPEYEVVEKGSSKTPGVILVSALALIGSIVGLFLDKENSPLWISLISLITGFWFKEVNFSGVKEVFSKGDPAKDADKRKQVAKGIAKELPEDYRAKIIKALWKKAANETKAEISRSDSEESMSKKSSKNLKQEIEHE